MDSLEREDSNGKIVFQFVLMVLTILQVEILSVTKIKDMEGNYFIVNALLLHSWAKPGLQKMAPELNEVLSQSVKIINHIKTVL
jgi:hypothetical protein